MRLVVIEIPGLPPGAAQKQEFDLDPRQGLDLWVVGRQVDSDIHLIDASVSRRHAELMPRPEGLIVRDLGSANGSFINDRAVKANSPQPARPGDRLRFGNVVVLLEAGSMAATFEGATQSNLPPVPPEGRYPAPQMPPVAPAPTPAPAPAPRLYETMPFQMGEGAVPVDQARFNATMPYQLPDQTFHQEAQPPAAPPERRDNRPQFSPEARYKPEDAPPYRELIPRLNKAVDFDQNSNRPKPVEPVPAPAPPPRRDAPSRPGPVPGPPLYQPAPAPMGYEPAPGPERGPGPVAAPERGRRKEKPAAPRPKRRRFPWLVLLPLVLLLALAGAGAYYYFNNLSGPPAAELPSGVFSSPANVENVLGLNLSRPATWQRNDSGANQVLFFQPDKPTTVFNVEKPPSRTFLNANLTPEAAIRQYLDNVKTNSARSSVVQDVSSAKLRDGTPAVYARLIFSTTTSPTVTDYNIMVMSMRCGSQLYFISAAAEGANYTPNVKQDLDAGVANVTCAR